MLVLLAATVTVVVTAPFRPALAQAAGLEVVKGDPVGTLAVGQTVQYPITVTNTSTTDVTNLVVADSIATVACPSDFLAPGASVQCTADYVITQSDLDSGAITNTATASGQTRGACSSGALTFANTMKTTTTLDGNPGYLGTVDLVDFSGARVATINVRQDATGGPATFRTEIPSPTVFGWLYSTNTELSNGEIEIVTASGATLDADQLVLDGRGYNVNGFTGWNDIDSFDVANDSGDTIFVSEVTVDEIINADAGDVLVPGTLYNESLVDVTAARAPGFQLGYNYGTLSDGATATFRFNKHAVGGFATEANSFTLAATGCVAPAVTVTGQDTVTTSLGNPELTVAKTGALMDGGANGQIDPEDMIDYTISVTNTGDVTITNIVLNDPLTEQPLCDRTTLAPGASASCFTSYYVTAADIDGGQVTNTVTVTGQKPDGSLLTATANEVTILPPKPSLGVVKTPPSGDLVVGDTINYDITVTNTGNVTLKMISLSDPLTNDETCPATTLATAESMSCTASYVITQADVDTGTVDNTATATGFDPSNTQATASGSATFPFTQTPGLQLDKSSVVNDLDGDSQLEPGETVRYTFLVTNTGNVTVGNIAIDDPQTAAPMCDATTLAPTASTTCRVTYVLTQSDLDAGQIINTATVTGTGPDGNALTGSSSVTTALAATPSMTVVKSNNAPELVVGSTIDYVITVTNTGNVTLSSVVVDDSLTGPPTCPTNTLGSGESMMCTASHVVTQAEFDTGILQNTATVTSLDPAGNPLNGSASSQSPFTQNPSLAVTKTASVVDTDHDDQIEPGETIDYRIVVANTGNVTINDIAVTDPLTTAPTCPKTQLAPGETMACTVTYSLTQADINAGQISNEATATGTDPLNTTSTASNTATVSLAASPSITVTKTAPAGDLVVGDTITYSFAVTNTGNVTLDQITLDDSLTTDESCPQSSLDAAASMTCTATWIITQADVDSGTVENTATVTAVDNLGGAVTNSDSAAFPLSQTPGLTLTNAGTAVDTNSNGQFDPGETVDYVFEITNTGNVTITSLVVSDPLTGAPTCTPTTLAPGQTATCAGTYVLTQANIDDGFVTNTAMVDGAQPDGTSTSATSSSTTTVPAVPAITVAKSAPNTGTAAGDTVSYSIEVTNTGNVTIDAIAIADPLTGDETCPQATLGGGESMTCTASYVITQGDVDTGTIDNTATVTGDDPNGGSLRESGSFSYPLATTSALLAETATVANDLNANDRIEAGETITYTTTVTNIGNGVVSDVGATDSVAGAMACDPLVLAPGESATCAVTYTVTQADVDAGSVTSIVTATATNPDASQTTATSDASTVITESAGLSVAKSAPAGDLAVGDTITYSIVVTNTGNVTIDGIVVVDELTADEACPRGALAGGDSMTCTASYVITQADVDTGTIENTATVTGDNPGGTTVGESGSFSYPLTTTSGLASDTTTTTDDVNLNGQIEAGETITYTTTVTNTGNVTVSDVGAADSVAGAMTCDPLVLAPGESATCSVTYTVTQADVDAGGLTTTVTATATNPDTSQTTATNEATTALAVSAGLSVVKSAPAGDLAVGDTVNYSIVVTNTGNVTIDALAIADPLTGDETCPQATLGGGESMTCTASYVITQGDVDTGTIDNTATVTGDDPSGVSLSESGSFSYPLTTTSALGVETATVANDLNANDRIEAGETIAYTTTVTNTGATTATNIEADAGGTPMVCGPTVLAPGETATCTATYTVTQDDVDAGSVATTVTATATNPDGSQTTGQGQATTSIASSPAISVVKSAPSDELTVGDTVNYSIVVTNSGNVTLDGIVVDDPLTDDEACPKLALAGGESMTCTASYTISQADVDNGTIENTATVTSTDPSAGTVKGSDSMSYPFAQTAKLTVQEVGVANDEDTDGQVEAGEPITYTITVTNIGNVTLSGAGATDSLAGTATCDVSELAPGQFATCTVSYTLTQDDLDAGTVSSTATATALAGTENQVTSESTGTVTIAAVPSLSMDKTGSGTTLGVGETIDYTIEVSNTGNVSLASIAIDDPLTSDEACPQSSLVPGETMSCSASYLITQADIDAGTVDNTASVAATDARGTSISDWASASYPFTPATELNVATSSSLGDTDGDGQLEPGETITFTVSATNSGTVTVTDLRVAAPTLGSATCDQTVLAPGHTAICTIAYTLTQADVDAGSVQANIAASVVAPDGTAFSGEDASSATVLATPSMSLVKAAPDGDLSVGTTIDYTIAVANTGNVTLSAIVIDDPLTLDEQCPMTSLGAGESTICTATWKITDADASSGSIQNTATVSAVDPSGSSVTATASNSYPAGAKPGPVDDVVTAEVGDTVMVDVMGNDTGDLMPETLALVDPKSGDAMGELIVPAEGTWSVVAGPYLQFVPLEELAQNPSPVTYMVHSTTGEVFTASASIMYNLEPGIPTPTPTPTFTPIPTPTPGPTETPVPTATPGTTTSPVPSMTPDATATAIPTGTAVPTQTLTPIPTGTAVPTPTLTPIPTPTPGSTETPVPTATPGPTTTPVASLTPDPTGTAIPTSTATMTPDGTGTAVPTGTGFPTSTPVSTITPGATSTIAPTGTPVSTITPEATSTVAPTGTPVPTGTPTPAVIPGSTATPHPTRVPVSPTPTATLSPPLAFTGSSTKPVVSTGLGLVLLGLVLAELTRRRRYR